MERVIERGCGLDVPKKTVTACVRVPGAPGAREPPVRTVGTTAAELLGRRDWIEAFQVTPVLLESTGVSGKPGVSVLEAAGIWVLANAAPIAKVLGRETDVKDCVGIAPLLEPGLMRGSVVPPPIREWRDLTRYRTALIQERTREAPRLHKVLEGAGITLASVASRVLGVSGRALLEAVGAGPTAPEGLADLARGRWRTKLPAGRQARGGRCRGPHAFLGTPLLAPLDSLDEAIATGSPQLDTGIAPWGRPENAQCSRYPPAAAELDSPSGGPLTPATGRPRWRARRPASCARW